MNDARRSTHRHQASFTPGSARRRCTATLLCAAFVALSMVPAARAAADPLPPPLQAALIRKIITYEPTLAKQTGKSLQVLIVADRASAQVTELRDALAAMGLQCTITSAAELATKMDGVQVLYLAAGTPPDAVKREATSRGILSVADGVEHAQRGDISVGIGAKDAFKPRIVVNLQRVALEKRSFSSSFLALAEVIR